MTRTFLCNDLKILNDAELCRLLWIYETYIFCVKTVKPSRFHDVFENGIICFVL